MSLSSWAGVMAGNWDWIQSFRSCGVAMSLGTKTLPSFVSSLLDGLVMYKIAVDPLDLPVNGRYSDKST